MSILGDLPIYVALDSADVWASPEWFQLDENNVPTGVAGVPPDYFSVDGQLWGNPLYDYDAMAGEVVCVIGPSGSGKSTFLRCLNRLEDVTEGEILVDGESITDAKANVDAIRRHMPL